MRPDGRDGVVPRRWTLHRLNNGLIFSATYHGVRTLPRAVSYAIGDDRHVDRMAVDARVPGGDRRQPSRDFSGRERRGAAAAGARNLPRLRIRQHRFPSRSRSHRRRTGPVRAHARRLTSFSNGSSSEGRGIIVVTGHCGNWEMGSFLMRRTVAARSRSSRWQRRTPTSIAFGTPYASVSGRTRSKCGNRLTPRSRFGGVSARTRWLPLLMDRHLGRDRVGGDAPRDGMRGSCERRRC